MESTRTQTVATILVIVFLPLILVPTAFAEEEAESENHLQRVHKVVVDCDEDSGENCRRKVHIQVMGGDDHFLTGEHPRFWMQAGGHGHHFTLGSNEGGFLGVQLTDLTPELRSHFGVPEDEGVMVGRVVDDSPAFDAGLAAGDIIIGVDGESIGSSMDLTRAIRSREEGDTVSLEVWRDGSFSIITATLDEQELPHMAHKAMFIDCDSGEDDCDFDFTAMTGHDIDFDCPDGEDCEVKISCDDGSCECTVNGESVDCPELHRAHHAD